MRRSPAGGQVWTLPPRELKKQDSRRRPLAPIQRQAAEIRAQSAALFCRSVVLARGGRGCQRSGVSPMTYGHAPQIGPPLAIIPLQIGCAPCLPPPQAMHGGARNSASRTSESIPLDNAKMLIAAAQTAIMLGLPFTRHITVHWETAGIRDAQAGAATTAFLKYLREWLRGATAYLWARENGEGKGSHLHILAHIPDGRQMSGAQSRRWIMQVSGQPYRAGTIRTVRIRGDSDPAGRVYAANLQTVLVYVLKGTDPPAAAALGFRHKAGGRIIGKRCGTSRNIGTSAQEAMQHG